MARRERARAGRVEVLRALLDRGDHGGARSEARRVLADGASTPEERAAAGTALRSLRPEPGAVALGAAAVIFAIAVTLWTVLGGP
jgi:hypothetical protein